MEKSKLSQLLAKLETLPIENDQNSFIILDRKCESLAVIYGREIRNNVCVDSSCNPGHNRGCGPK